MITNENAKRLQDTLKNFRYSYYVFYIQLDLSEHMIGKESNLLDKLISFLSGIEDPKRLNIK